eukprot:scaffold108480_cov17-Prasinocladus_malaysianus.AAC.1
MAACPNCTPIDWQISRIKAPECYYLTRCMCNKRGTHLRRHGDEISWTTRPSACMSLKLLAALCTKVAPQRAKTFILYRLGDQPSTHPEDVSLPVQRLGPLLCRLPLRGLSLNGSPEPCQKPLLELLDGCGASCGEANNQHHFTASLPARLKYYNNNNNNNNSEYGNNNDTKIM